MSESRLGAADSQDKDGHEEQDSPRGRSTVEETRSAQLVSLLAHANFTLARAARLGERIGNKSSADEVNRSLADLFSRGAPKNSIGNDRQREWRGQEATPSEQQQQQQQTDRHCDRMGIRIKPSELLFSQTIERRQRAARRTKSQGLPARGGISGGLLLWPEFNLISDSIYVSKRAQKGAATRGAENSREPRSFCFQFHFQLPQVAFS